MLKPSEYLVALRTGSNYWHVLRKTFNNEKSAVEYSKSFDGFDSVILEVKQIYQPPFHKRILKD